MTKHHPSLFDWPFTANTRTSRRTPRREAPAPRPAARPRPAAGVLLRHRDADGYWYLLGLRCRAHGGTWANLGGSLDRGEAPLAGALRELAEETEIRAAALAGGRIVGELQTGRPAKPYTLFVIDVPVAIDDAVLNYEHDELYWWHSDDVPTLALYDGMAAAWLAVTALEDPMTPEEAADVARAERFAELAELVPDALTARIRASQIAAA